MSTITGVKSNIKKKLTYFNQFASNSNKILLFIHKNLILKSDKNLILPLKILKSRFHQDWWQRTKSCVLFFHLMRLLNPWLIIEIQSA